MNWFYPGKTRGQAAATMFPNLHDAGMPPLHILRAIATSADGMLGWQGRVDDGTWKIECIRFEIKEGQAAKNELASR